MRVLFAGALPLSYAANGSGIRTRTTGPSEVTLVFTTGKGGVSCIQTSAGEPVDPGTFRRSATELRRLPHEVQSPDGIRTRRPPA